jgi:hypothetical protein
MDFWQTMVVLVRRWYIAVPTAIGSLLLTAVAYTFVPPQYESGAVLALTTPLAGGTVAPSIREPTSLTNPLTNFDRSLSLTGSIIIQEMNTSSTAADLGVQPGGAVTYAVSNGSANPELLETGPFVFVQGIGPTPEAAEAITSRVVEKVVEVLDARQEALRAPDPTRILPQVVVPVTEARPLTGSSARAAAAALGIAVTASLFAVYGFESFATRTRRRPGFSRAAPEQEPPEVDAQGSDASAVPVTAGSP